MHAMFKKKEAQKKNCVHILMAAKFFFNLVLTWLKIKRQWKSKKKIMLHSHVHSSIIHNSQKVEAT